jgi:xylulokinase
MNLLNIITHSWDELLLSATAPNLREKLGEPCSSTSKIGNISKYWCKKYGFSPDCEIFAFSGDNPCSLIGLGLNSPGDIGISLGTSDVMFAVTNNPIPNAEEGSILVHPEDEKSYMIMIVFKNGDTVRKHVRDEINLNDNDWNLFNQSILNTPVGRNGNISFYYVENEITPNLCNTGILKFDKYDQLIKDQTLNENDCRGLIESKVVLIIELNNLNYYYTNVSFLIGSII